MFRAKLVLAGLFFCGLLVTGQGVTLAEFADDFEDGDIAGWSVHSGTWRAVDDGTGNKVLKSENTDAGIYIDELRGFEDFDFSIDVKFPEGPAWEILVLRAQNGWDSGYAVKLYTDWKDVPNQQFLPKLYFYKGGHPPVAVGSLNRYTSLNNWLKVRVVARGNKFEGYVQDSKGEEKLFTYVDEDNTYPIGSLGLFNAGRSSVQFDNVRVIRVDSGADTKSGAPVSFPAEKLKIPVSSKSTEVRSHTQAYLPFEDNFDKLPVGTMVSDKWDIATESEGNRVEVIEEKGRGKVIHVRAAKGYAYLSPKKLTFGEIPYTLEFDLKVPPAETRGEVTNFGNLQLMHRDPDRKFSGWAVHLLDYAYVYYIPELSKAYHQPTQATGQGWGRVRVEVDSDRLTFSVHPEGHSAGSGEIFPLFHWEGKPGRLYFRARPPWEHETTEFWLDNVVIRPKPVAERQAYKRRHMIYRELKATFSGKDYRAMAGESIPSELTEADKLLKEIAALPETEVAGYRQSLAELDRLLERCALAYRKYEPRIFSAAFTQQEIYKPIDISALYNYTPKKRPGIFRHFRPLVEIKSVPFWVSPVGPYALEFSLEEKSSVKIPIGETAKEIFLLLKPHWEVDFLGSGTYPDPDDPKGETPIGLRDYIKGGASEALPVAFQVEIRYGDGKKEKAYPLLYPWQSPVMKRDKISVYSIKPSRRELISSIVLHDKMNDWGCTVYGVTLGTGRPEPAKAAQPQKFTPAKSMAAGPAKIKMTAGNVVFESPAYRIGMAKSGVLSLTEFFNKYTDENFLTSDSGPMLLTGPFAPAAQYSQLIKDKTGNLVPAKPESPHFETWHIKQVKRKSTDEVIFHIENSGKNLSGTLLVKAEFDQVRMKATLKNTGSKQRELTVIFPLFKNIKAQGYFAPLRMGIVSDQPLDFNVDYGSNHRVMMQMMAVWDKKEQAGISLRVEDTSGEMKSFRLYKPAPGGNPPATKIWSAGCNVEKYLAEHIGPIGDGMVLGVQYFYLSLKPGESRKLPPAVIGVHPGTWKPPLLRYAEWVKTWWHPLRVTPERLRRVALSVTGGNLDVPTHKTGLEWGGVDVVHLMDIHSVDYPAEIEKRIPALRESREMYARRKPPLGRGVYTTDGSFLRTTTKLYRDFGNKWALKDEQGNLDWFQPLTKEQLRICRVWPLWSQYISEACALVAGGVNPVWVYVDTIGVAGSDMCFDKEHNHSSPVEGAIRGQARVMEAVTRAVMKANPEVAVMTEGAGCDYLMQFMDGAWSKILGWETVANPGRFMFFRYVIPTFKFMELTGDSVTRSKINYFNGVPVNIYIYGGEDRTQTTLRPLVKGYREFWDIFTGKEMEVDVPTGAQGVYMNRFGSREQSRIVYAVANWGYQTWQGDLTLDYFPDAHYVEVTRDNKELKYAVLKDRDKAKVEFSIDPYEVAYIGVLKRSP